MSEYQLSIIIANLWIITGLVHEGWPGWFFLVMGMAWALYAGLHRNNP